jgi:taurine dioxygenase
MNIEIFDLDAPLGAEVRGIDLHGTLDTDVVARLLEAFDRCHMLLFRNQDLSGEEQVQLCRHFGPIAPEAAGGYGYVSNARDTGVLREGALPFHSDFAFTHDPVKAISLFAEELPTVGAPTVFADAVCALDRMPASLRKRIAPHAIVNVYDFTLPTDRRMRERDLAPGSPVVERHMIGVHPRTGAAVVNANAMHTDRVVGVTEAESEALLAELFDALYGPDNTFTLDWAVGDLAVWDNIALQHHRPDFPATQPRTMRRVCIHDKTALELVPNMAELVAR